MDTVITPIVDKVKSLLFPIHESHEMEQAGKKVEDRNVQGHGRHDVVGFAAVDDAAGLVEDQACHEQHEHGGYRQ